MLIIAGLLLAGIGVLLTLGERLPFKLGHLPGDITYHGKNVTVYLPIGTCLLLSVILSLLLWLFRKAH